PARPLLGAGGAAGGRPDEGAREQRLRRRPPVASRLEEPRRRRVVRRLVEQLAQAGGLGLARRGAVRRVDRERRRLVVAKERARDRIARRRRKQARYVVGARQ